MKVDPKSGLYLVFKQAEANRKAWEQGRWGLPGSLPPTNLNAFHHFNEGKRAREVMEKKPPSSSTSRKKRIEVPTVNKKTYISEEEKKANKIIEDIKERLESGSLLYNLIVKGENKRNKLKKLIQSAFPDIEFENERSDYILNKLQEILDDGSLKKALKKDDYTAKTYRRDWSYFISNIPSLSKEKIKENEGDYEQIHIGINDLIESGSFLYYLHREKEGIKHQLSSLLYDYSLKDELSISYSDRETPENLEKKIIHHLNDETLAQYLIENYWGIDRQKKLQEILSKIPSFTHEEIQAKIAEEKRIQQEKKRKETIEQNVNHIMSSLHFHLNKKTLLDYLREDGKKEIKPLQQIFTKSRNTNNPPLAIHNAICDIYKDGQLKIHLMNDSEKAQKLREYFIAFLKRIPNETKEEIRERLEAERKEIIKQNVNHIMSSLHFHLNKNTLLDFLKHDGKNEIEKLQQIFIKSRNTNNPPLAIHNAICDIYKDGQLKIHLMNDSEKAQKIREYFIAFLDRIPNKTKAEIKVEIERKQKRNKRIKLSLLFASFLIVGTPNTENITNTENKNAIQKHLVP